MEQLKDTVRNMNYAVNGTIAVYGTFAKNNGLNYNSLMVLYVIEDKQKCTQKDICEVLQLSKSTVHSILLDFVKKGYMVLETEPQNRKEKNIVLTEEGKRYLDSIMAKIHELESRALGKLNDETREWLVKSNIAFYEAFKAGVEHE